jgi:hypothetical protein
MCFGEEQMEYFFESPSQKFVVNSDSLGEVKNPFLKSARLGNNTAVNQKDWS